MTSPSFFIDAVGDGKGNFMTVFSNTSDMFIYYYNKTSYNKLNYLPSDDSLTIKYKYTSPNVVYGGNNVWLISAYDAQSDYCGGSSAISILYTINNGNNWSFSTTCTTNQNQNKNLAILGLDIVTDQQSFWMVCSVWNEEPFVDHPIFCQQFDFLDNDTNVPIYNLTLTSEYYFDDTNTETYNGRPYKYDHFLSFGSNRIMLIYTYSNSLYYATRTITEYLWTKSGFSTDNLGSDNKILNFRVEHNSKDMFFAGFGNTVDGINNGRDGGLFYFTLLNECAYTFICDPETTSGCVGGDPEDPFYCACLPGYKALFDDPTTCYDPKNKCRTFNGGCNQICTNVKLDNVTYSVNCSCFTGYTYNTTSKKCDDISLWEIQTNPLGPAILNSTSAIFSSQGLVFVHGENSNPLQNKPIWRYVITRNKWDSYTTNSFALRQNPCLYADVLNLWIVGGATDSGFEIWSYDIVVQDFSKYEPLDNLDINIPELQFSSCIFTTNSEGKSMMYIFGGYEISSVADSNVMYELELNLDTLKIVNMSFLASTTPTGPSSTFSGLFVPRNEISNVLLVGGERNVYQKRTQVIERSLVLYHYLEQGRWESLNIVNNTHYHDLVSSSYFITHNNGKIILYNLNTSAIYQLLQTSSSLDTWALALLYKPEVLLQLGSPLSLSTVDTLDTESPKVMLMTTLNTKKNLALFSLDTRLAPNNACLENSFCIDPAVCFDKPGALSGYICVCPDNFEILPDKVSCRERTVFGTNDKIIIGVVVALVVILIIVGLQVYFFRRKIDLSILPNAICWSFNDYFMFPARWSKLRGTSKTFYKLLSPSSPDYNKVSQLLYGQLHGKHKDVSVRIAKLYALVNPTLLSQFVTYAKLTKTRYRTDPTIFRDTSWKSRMDAAARQFVYDKFMEKVRQFEWNDDKRIADGLPVLLAIHGTDNPIAWKVAEKGFVAISKLDAGFYGKGIYFTSYTLYTLPYIGGKKLPTLLLTYVLPGDPYPVVENHQGKNSLLGKGLQGSAISHYVVTKSNGTIGTMDDLELYDELVFAQESALLPAFLIELDKSNFKELSIAFTESSKSKIDDSSSSDEVAISKPDVVSARIIPGLDDVHRSLSHNIMEAQAANNRVLDEVIPSSRILEQVSPSSRKLEQVNPDYRMLEDVV